MALGQGKTDRNSANINKACLSRRSHSVIQTPGPLAMRAAPATAIKLRDSVLALLAVFLVLLSAQAAYPPEADLGIEKEAGIGGGPVAEVRLGAAFEYVITVTNHYHSHSAHNVVVTDKLPYKVAIGSVNVGSSLGPSAFSRPGDLVYVRFDEIPANSTGQIIISVTAPEEALTTLYSIAKIRYVNDPNPANRRVTFSTYVPLLGYDQLGSAEGLPGREALEGDPASAVSGCESCQRE